MHNKYSTRNRSSREEVPCNWKKKAARPAQNPRKDFVNKKIDAGGRQTIFTNQYIKWWR